MPATESILLIFMFLFQEIYVETGNLHFYGTNAIEITISSGIEEHKNIPFGIVSSAAVFERLKTRYSRK